MAVGYRDNAETETGLGAYASFGGQTVDATSVLIRMTRGADADLDGEIGGNDTSITGSFQGLSNTGHWYLGDFDYSGGCTSAEDDLAIALYEATSPPLN